MSASVPVFVKVQRVIYEVEVVDAVTLEEAMEEVNTWGGCQAVAAAYDADQLAEISND